RRRSARHFCVLSLKGESPVARFIRRLGRWGVWLVLPVALLLLRPAPAAAYIEIDYSIDNGPRQFGAVSPTGTSVSFNASHLGGFFDVAMTFASSNSPGDPTIAYIQQSNTWISADYSSGQHTLTIYASSTDFTAPTTPPPLKLSAASSTNLLN